jgi:hypothetical protein
VVSLLTGCKYLDKDTTSKSENSNAENIYDVLGVDDPNEIEEANATMQEHTLNGMDYYMYKNWLSIEGDNGITFYPNGANDETKFVMITAQDIDDETWATIDEDGLETIYGWLADSIGDSYANYEEISRTSVTVLDDIEAYELQFNSTNLDVTYKHIFTYFLKNQKLYSVCVSEVDEVTNLWQYETILERISFEE